MDRTPHETSDPGRRRQRGESADDPRSETHETQTIARDLGEDAEDLAADFAQTGRETAESYMRVAARRLAGLAQAVDAAASELEDQHQDEFANRAHEVASGLDHVAERLDQSDFETLMSDAREWAQDAPAAFLGGSVAVGFALSRFFSASRESSASSEPPEDDQEWSETSTASMPANDFETLEASPRPASSVPTAPIGASRASREE